MTANSLHPGLIQTNIFRHFTLNGERAPPFPNSTSFHQKILTKTDCIHSCHPLAGILGAALLQDRPAGENVYYYCCCCYYYY